MFRDRQHFLAFALALGLASGNSALALSSDKDQPIEVEANGVEIDEGKAISYYRGDVVIVQGSIRLEADLVEVHYKGSKPERLIATGNPVRFQQRPDDGKELVKGEGKRLDYMVATEEMILTDQAVLRQGKDSFRSDRIVYDRVQAKLKAGAAAAGKERVRVQIQPKSAQ